MYLAISHWDNSLPTITIHYSENGKEEFRYIWSVQDRVYKGGMQPGGGTFDNGHLFPDDKFFMGISWWSKNVRAHCVNITPKWPNTDIYLDAYGDIDLSETSGIDLDRLKQCITDAARP
ncbi:hypothetical protein [Pseudomonas putida]|uniref:hypothetical protein n=1 Tax=Pseudomonas putida TaxID=303 RepID=UPI00062B08AF|nr:hypothetical protein [Pseudomonas putida]KKX58521.1 hypothetical protein PU99_24500 [Pseudomonas putida]